MNEFFALMSPQDITVTAVLVGVAVAVITRRLVWHTDLKKVEKERDRWQQIAIDALMGPAQAGVKAAEIAVDVVSALPDPKKDRV